MNDLGWIAIVIIILSLSFCGEPHSIGSISSMISCDNECTENKETDHE